MFTNYFSEFIHQVAIKFKFWNALQKKCFQSDIIFRHYVKMPPVNLKGRISVKINLIAIKFAHAHLYYVHKKYSRYQKDSLEIVVEVNYTNSVSNNAKPKWLCLKGRNSVKIIYSPSKLHMHIFIMSTKKYTRLQKTHWKLCEELITQTLYCKAWRTDRRTDRGKS